MFHIFSVLCLSGWADLRCTGRGHRAQGRDRRELAYYNPLQPGLAIWGVFWTTIFILVNGYKVFFVWNTQDFLTAYINIPIFFFLWIGWSVYMRTSFWRPEEMDFVTVRWGASITPLTGLIFTRLITNRVSRLSKRQTLPRYLHATWVKRSSAPSSKASPI